MGGDVQELSWRILGGWNFVGVRRRREGGWAEAVMACWGGDWPRVLKIKYSVLFTTLRHCVGSKKRNRVFCSQHFTTAQVLNRET